MLRLCGHRRRDKVLRKVKPYVAEGKSIPERVDDLPAAIRGQSTATR